MNREQTNMEQMNMEQMNNEIDFPMPIAIGTKFKNPKIVTS